MSDRTYAHVVVKYVCCYGNASFSSEDAMAVGKLFDDFEVEVWLSDEDCQTGNWEIDADGLKACIKRLEKLKPTAKCKYFKRSKGQYSNADVLAILKDWLKHADKEDHMVRVHWI